MADIKQYVNLDPTKPKQLDGLDKARAGKTVVLAATIAPKKSGIPIAFEITHGAQNVARPGHTERRIATTTDDGKATLSYDLSEHGGDEFTVKASLALGPKKGQALSSDKYIVWRRLYYQMSRFKAGTPGKGQPDGSVPEVAAYDISPAEAELAAREHNIELVDKTTTDLIKRYANVMTSDDDSKAFKKSGKDSYDKALEPVALRVVIIHELATAATAKITQLAIANSTTVSVTFPHHLWEDLTKEKETDWLVEGHWRFLGDTDWQSIPQKWIKKTASNKASIDLDGAELGAGGMWWWRKEVDRTRTIDVRLTYRYAAGSANGMSWYNAIWLASSNMNQGARTADAMKQTAIHEIGHFIGMVPTTQSTHYANHGHQGGHCTQGLLPSQITTNPTDPYNGLSGTCIMFGENAPSRLPKFCADCDPSVRKSPVQRTGMPKSW
jgi:hypothetical protein